jgi:hypothetical protein
MHCFPFRTKFFLLTRIPVAISLKLAVLKPAGFLFPGLHEEGAEFA